MTKELFSDVNHLINVTNANIHSLNSIFHDSRMSLVGLPALLLRITFTVKTVIVLMDAGTLTYYPQVKAEKAFQAENAKREMPLGLKLGRLFEELSERVREDFFSFLNQLGLASESRMLVIPSTRHFFYDADELKEIDTIINLKQLNYIREIKDFLSTISRLLPDKSNFVGCFTDNRANNGFSDKFHNRSGFENNKEEVYENGIESRIPFINRMYSIIDARTNRYLTRRSVTTLLAECGLMVIRMKELNGMTYFYTKKTKPAA